LSFWYGFFTYYVTNLMKTTLLCPASKAIKRRSQRRKHCALAVVRRSQKISFRPTSDPLPGGAGRPEFNQLEMVTTFTYKPSLVRIDARNFFGGDRRDHVTPLLRDKLHWLRARERITFKLC